MQIYISAAKEVNGVKRVFEGSFFASWMFYSFFP